jgi:hypothetical protein
LATAISIKGMGSGPQYLPPSPHSHLQKFIVMIDKLLHNDGVIHTFDHAIAPVFMLHHQETGTCSHHHESYPYMNQKRDSKKARTLDVIWQRKSRELICKSLES